MANRMSSAVSLLYIANPSFFANTACTPPYDHS